MYRRALAFMAIAAAGASAGAAARSEPAADRQCAGSEQVLFDNTNGFGVGSGGSPPSFSTKGRPYCLTYIEHYHWNNGKGDAPGKVGLRSASGAVVGPFQALGSAGQGGAKNVNHYAYVPRSPVTLIDGTYTCTDTHAATWSSNTQSGGQGFCIVKGIPWVATGGDTVTTTTTQSAPRYDLSVHVQPLTSVAKPEAGHLFFATELIVANSTEAGRASDVTLLRPNVDGMPDALRDRLHVTGPTACSAKGCTVPALRPGQETYWTLWLAGPKVPAGKLTLRPVVRCDASEETTCANNVFPRKEGARLPELIVEAKSTTVITTADAPSGADLRAEVDAFENGKPPSAYVHFSLFVFNDGPEAAKDVDVLVTGPGGDFRIVGDDCGRDGAVSWRCRVGVMPKGKLRLFVVHAYATAGRYAAQIAVRSSTHDPRPANNKATRATSVP